ncbi:MAG TPA: hypothetical protein VFE98_09290 [Candidatus Bathyarchaeia archaeon]|nr:hypothetical protein [Candidatus Bathyarchaeia archaeon]
MEKTENFPTYVFATVNPSRIPKVVEELKHHREIDFIAPVNGRFNLALRLKPHEYKEVYNEIKKIRAIPDVKTTVTQSTFEGVKHSKKFENEMPFGISLMNFEPTEPFEKSLERLEKIPGLVEAFTVPGEFDIVAFWQAKTTEEIMKNSIEKLSSIEGLYRNETLFGRTPFFKP